MRIMSPSLRVTAVMSLPIMERRSRRSHSSFKELLILTVSLRASVTLAVRRRRSSQSRSFRRSLQQRSQNLHIKITMSMSSRILAGSKRPLTFSKEGSQIPMSPITTISDVQSSQVNSYTTSMVRGQTCF